MNTDLRKAIKLLERVARTRKPKLLHGEITLSFARGRICNWHFRDTHRRKDLEEKNPIELTKKK